MYVKNFFHVILKDLKRKVLHYVIHSLFNLLCETLKLFGILRITPFVNHKGKDVNSDWLVDLWDERSVLGPAQFHKGRMMGDDHGDDPEIDTAQTPKRFSGHLALLEKIQRLHSQYPKQKRTIR